MLKDIDYLVKWVNINTLEENNEKNKERFTESIIHTDKID